MKPKTHVNTLNMTNSVKWNQFTEVGTHKKHNPDKVGYYVLYVWVCPIFKWVQIRWCKLCTFKDFINLSTLCLSTIIHFENCHFSSPCQHTHTHTVLSLGALSEPRRRCGPGCKPCHLKQRAGWRKMRGVKRRKQLVRSPEDINLRGETRWQERPSNKAWYYCCKGVCVC